MQITLNGHKQLSVRHVPQLPDMEQIEDEEGESEDEREEEEEDEAPLVVVVVVVFARRRVKRDRQHRQRVGARHQDRPPHRTQSRDR